jgi:ribosomal protein S18 acetylase RimI-like enzyme
MIATSNGRIISFVFAGFADSPSVTEIPFNLGAREAYLWGAYCLPQHRSKGVQTANTLALCRWLQDNGYESSFLLTDKHNEAAIRHIQKMGFQKEAQLITLRILRWCLSRYIPLEQDELCEEPGAKTKI